MSTALLLTLYVTVDTTRALLVFGALHSGVELSPSALTFAAEAVKLLLIAVPGVLITTPTEPGQSRFLLRRGGAGTSTNNGTSGWESLKPYLRFAIPAALYGTNNVLYFTGLKITSPALLQVCVLSKLPLTALLHHIVIKPRRSRPMWFSLAILTFGLVLAGSPQALWNGTRIDFSELISGPVIGLTVGVVSACSSVYTELALKENIGFWQAQTYLYFWGTLFAGFAALVSHLRSTSSAALPVSSASTFIDSLPAFSLVVTVTALTGLVVALILRQKDNLVKLVGSSLCITTVFVLQHLFFPTTDGLDFRTTFGIGVLTLATWTYNHYKEIGDHAVPPSSRPVTAEYSQLSTSEDLSPELIHSKDAPMSPPSTSPDTPSASFSSESPAFPPTHSQLVEKAVEPDVYAPTPARLLIGFALVLLVSSLTSLQTPSSTSASNVTAATSGDKAQDALTSKDLSTYFEEKGLKKRPASWIRFSDGSVPDEEKGSDEGCIEKVRGSLTQEGEDMGAELEENGCQVFPLPDQGFITHLFWSGERWRIPTFQLVTDSWLATQDVSASHRLVWWYDSATTPAPPHTFTEKYVSPGSPFRTIVSFRPFEESAITSESDSCLREMKEWKDENYRKRIEMPAMTRKSLVKLWLLERFGGVWLDVDTVLLRDLTPIFRLGPTVVVENDFVDDSLMISGPTWGTTGHAMMETACQLPFETNELMTKFPALALKAGPTALYTEGVLRLCEQEGCGLSRLPSSLISVPSTVQTCHVQSTLESKKIIRDYFSSLYTWSPELLARHDDDTCWNEEDPEGQGATLLGIVRMRVEQVLNERSRPGRSFEENTGSALFTRDDFPLEKPDQRRKNS